jgi:hypothetical protein
MARLRYSPDPGSQARVSISNYLRDDDRLCCVQQTGAHEMVVEALLVIYLFCLDSKLILVDIGSPVRSSTCLVRYSWFLSSWSLPGCGVRACESPPKRGLYATRSSRADRFPHEAMSARGREVSRADHRVLERLPKRKPVRSSEDRAKMKRLAACALQRSTYR